MSDGDKAELQSLIDDEVISPAIGRHVATVCKETGKTPTQVVEEQRLRRLGGKPSGRNISWTKPPGTSWDEILKLVWGRD